MATEAQLKQALLVAHRKGDKRAADLFAAEIKKMRLASQTPAQSIPIFDNAGNPIEPDAPMPKRETTLKEDIIGAGETAATALTGATTGALGYVQGLGTGLVDTIAAGEFGTQKGVDRIAETAGRFAAQGAYTPKTEAGQRQVAALGEAASMLPPTVAGFSPAQLAGAGQAARASMQVTPTAVRETAQVARQALPSRGAQSSRSIGAAEVPAEIVQLQKFQDLPTPVPVTMSDIATGDERFKWKQIENEYAKDAENGAELRDIAARKNAAIQQNFEDFIDMTGTTVPEGQYQYITGEKVRGALQEGKREGKVRVTAAYQRAREAGELEQPIPQERVDVISNFINDSRAERANAPVLSSFVDEVVNVRGLGTGSIEDGTFRISNLTLDQAETLRQRLRKLQNDANSADVAAASQIRTLIDQAQEGLGGNFFKSARKVAKQEFDKYENNTIIKSILSNKGKSNDPKVAAEQIVQKAVFGGSVDDLDNFRLTLMKSGAKGMEAWRDVQAATLRTIRDEALRGKSTVDTAGLVKAQAGTINKLVDNLDKNGKLNKLFGKKGADQLRLLREVSGHIAEQMPGTLNTSNTAAAWVMFMRDIPVIGKATTAIEKTIPLVRDARLRSKINKAINVDKTLKQKGIDPEKYGLKPQK